MDDTLIHLICCALAIYKVDKFSFLSLDFEQGNFFFLIVNTLRNKFMLFPYNLRKVTFLVFFQGGLIAFTFSSVKSLILGTLSAVLKHYLK